MKGECAPHLQPHPASFLPPLAFLHTLCRPTGRSSGMHHHRATTHCSCGHLPSKLMQQAGGAVPCGYASWRFEFGAPGPNLWCLHIYIHV